MSFKNLLSVLVALAATTVVLAQTNLATCDFVFIPGTPVDPASTNVVADFNFIAGHELIVAAPSHSGFIAGATFTENPDDVFNVHNQFSANGWTCEETAAFLEGLAGQTFPGPSGVNWSIQSADCTCDN